MPLRIYEIATKLRLENRQVLAKANALGITAARVASSSLDKVTAEFLEQQLLADISSNGAAPPPDAQGDENGVPEEILPGITVKTTSPEIHGLVRRILAGEIPFLLEASLEDGSPPLRARLVSEDTSALTNLTPRTEPQPRAELDERTKDRFRAAYYAAKVVSKDEWVNLAEVGSALKREDQTFHPQDFGERSLGGLIRRNGDFEIKTDGNAPPVYYIRLKGLPSRAQPEMLPAPAQPVGPTRSAAGKIHNLKLGFGFIAPDDGSENSFFHASEVLGCTIFDLRPGDRVEYQAGTNERGPCAWKVRRTGATLR